MRREDKTTQEGAKLGRGKKDSYQDERETEKIERILRNLKPGKYLIGKERGSMHKRVELERVEDEGQCNDAIRDVELHDCSCRVRVSTEQRL